MTKETNRPTYGVVLSGCGVRDGSEIHEATLLLLALEKAGVNARCFAPDKAQACVVDHLTGESEGNGDRNVLVESARIARGAIEPLSALDPMSIDGLAFPGGFGAALNLSDYGLAGADMRVDEEVRAAIEAMHQAHKPLGFACIAPVLAARVLGARHPKLTIGNDAQTAAHLEAMGARHVDAPADGVVVDEVNRVVTTPAYMLASGLSEVARGMDNLVAAMLALGKAR